MGLGAGMRHWINEKYELEGRFSAARIDISPGDTQTEVSIAAGGRFHVTRNVAIGPFASFTRNTDPNFDNIRKVELSVRYQF